MVDVVAADVTSPKAGGDRDMLVGASGAQSEVATVDGATIREADTV
jgi:hypothetical protein